MLSKDNNIYLRDSTKAIDLITTYRFSIISTTGPIGNIWIDLEGLGVGMGGVGGPATAVLPGLSTCILQPVAVGGMLCLVESAGNLPPL